MRTGQARRRDANEADIVDALERRGVTVIRLSGPGVPDLLTYYRGRWLPLEIKSAVGELTPAQCLAYSRAKYPIARTADHAVALVIPPRQLRRIHLLNRR